MKSLSAVPLLMLSVLLGACSGSDAPPTPKVARAASAAETTTPSSGPAASADAATSPPAIPAAPAAVEPAPAPAADVAAQAAPSAPATSTAAPDPGYEVSCPSGATAAEQCQVDKDTYIGWRTFSAQCQVCHGGSALGSTFAPNLLDRFHQRVDHARFVEVVTNGFRGQVGAMPAWKGNPNVIPHIDQLYRYLKARADGVLPPGRPERKP